MTEMQPIYIIRQTLTDNGIAIARKATDKLNDVITSLVGPYKSVEEMQNEKGADGSHTLLESVATVLTDNLPDIMEPYETVVADYYDHYVSSLHRANDMKTTLQEYIPGVYELGEIAARNTSKILKATFKYVATLYGKFIKGSIDGLTIATINKYSHVNFDSLKSVNQNYNQADAPYNAKGVKIYDQESHK
jgi:hypothetical protein